MLEELRDLRRHLDRRFDRVDVLLDAIGAALDCIGSRLAAT